jgi:hypothetical protein
LSAVAEFFIIGERFVVITRQLQAAEVLSRLLTMNDKLSFVKVPLVITKQLMITKQLIIIIIINYTQTILKEYQLCSLQDCGTLCVPENCAHMQTADISHYIL